MTTLEELKEQLIAQYPALRAGMAGSAAARPRVTLQETEHLRKEGLVFAVNHHGVDHYPLFQFDESTGKPKPVIGELIKIFGLPQSGSWELFIWLGCPTGLLGGAKPLDIVEQAPDKVLEAAKRERAEPHF